MGSSCETVETTVDYLLAKGEKVGLIKVHLYRPFSSKYFFDVFPKTVKRIAVLDRTKEPGALGEPLLEDVKSLFYDCETKPLIIGGRYDLAPELVLADIIACFKNLKAEQLKTLRSGIIDDVTNLSPAGSSNRRYAGRTIRQVLRPGSDGTGRQQAGSGNYRQHPACMPRLTLMTPKVRILYCIPPALWESPLSHLT